MGAAPITQPASSAGALAAVPRWIAVIAVALAAFSGPLLFGAVETWAWAALWAVAAAAVVTTFAVWINEGRIACVPAPAAIIAVLLALVALAQLVPLPARAFSLLGRCGADVHRILFGSRGHPASLAPAGTLEAFLKASLVLMLSAVTLCVARTRAMLFTVVAAVAASALFASAMGIVQEKPGRERIYRFRDLE